MSRTTAPQLCSTQYLLISVSVDFILLVAGLICLALAAANVTVSPRISLGWLGLFLIFVREIIK